MANEDDQLDESPPGLDWPADHPPTAGDDTFYACEVGTALWKHYRRFYPTAPERPPGWPEIREYPGAGDYLRHVSTCLNCRED